MNQPLKITGNLLTRNWLLNLAGQVLPLFVALATIPYVIRGLGTERFGILSIAWVLLGYLGLFDLGLGRATTKFVAECLGRGETEKLPALVWTSLWSQALFGVAGAALAAGAAPLLVDHLLKLSPALRGETRLTFFVLAGSLPVVLVGNALRGVLEAGQHFDVVNYVKIPANAAVFLLPAVALPLGLGLPGIVTLLVLARLGASMAFLLYCFRLFPVVRRSISGDRALLRPLLSYGGWVTVSNVVGPCLTYMDRFFIGSMISVAAVGFYTAPYEAITRASVVPASLATALFPAFTHLEAEGSHGRLDELCARSLKSLLLILGPALILVIAFAHDILRLWLGVDFARRGAVVLQILAVGVLMNSLAYIPFGLLQGIGRPDLTAKFHLWELPFYVGALWFLLGHMGLRGAALAWTLRVSMDAVLLFSASFGLRFVSLQCLAGTGLRKTIAAVLVFGLSLSLFWLLGWPLLAQVILTCLLLTLFAISVWRYVLDGRDRSLLTTAAWQLRAAVVRTK